MDTALAIKFFGALLAIMNPVTNLPVFLSVTEGASASDQRAIALKTGLFTLILGGCFAIAGTQVLAAFGISIDGFRAAGGLVVLLLALNMLSGEQSQSHHGSGSEQAGYPEAASVAFYPLTFPIIVGPGTITTLILFFHQAKGVPDLMLLGAVFAGLVAAVTIVFYFAADLGGYLSATARVVMSRLMGMILAAIAVEMIADGLKVLLPGLAG